MQIARKRLGAMVLAACLLVALAFGGTLAVAAGEWAPGGPNKLDVYAQSNENLAADLASEDVKLAVDVYQLATGQEDAAYETYNYTLAFPFATESMQELFDAALDRDSAGDWEAVGDAAKELIGDAEPVATGQMGTNGTLNLSFDEKGIFMAVPHGVSADAFEAYGPIYKYEFKPSVFALPTKDAIDGVIGTAAEYGDWLNETTIDLKVGEDKLTGSLKIVKRVSEFKGTPVAFGFHIDSTADSPVEYHGADSIRLTKGTEAEVVVTGIPAGAIVTVTESYDGAGYQFLRAEDAEGITIVSDGAIEAGADMPVATIINEPSDDTPGDGIKNTFEWSEDKGDWELVSVTPTDAQREAPED